MNFGSWSGRLGTGACPHLKCRAPVWGLGPCRKKLVPGAGDPLWLDQALRRPGSWLGLGAWVSGRCQAGSVPVCIL